MPRVIVWGVCIRRAWCGKDDTARRARQAMLTRWGGGAIMARRTVMTVLSLSMLTFTLMAVLLIPTPKAHIVGLI